MGKGMARREKTSRQEKEEKRRRFERWAKRENGRGKVRKGRRGKI